MERCSEVILYPLTVPPPAPHQPLQLYKVTACLMSSLLRPSLCPILAPFFFGMMVGQPFMLKACGGYKEVYNFALWTSSLRPSPPQPAPRDHPYPSLLPKTIPTPACSPRPSLPQPAPQDHPYPSLLPKTIPTPACSPRPSLPQPAPRDHPYPSLLPETIPTPTCSCPTSSRSSCIHFMYCYLSLNSQMNCSV